MTNITEEIERERIVRKKDKDYEVDKDDNEIWSGRCSPINRW